MRRVRTRLQTIAEAITRPQTVSGTFYRVESGFTHQKGATAKDVIDWEADEIGNDDCIEGREKIEQFGIDLSNFSAKDIIWVTKNKEDAQRYAEEYGGDINDIEIKEGIVVVPDDGDGGSLILITKK